MNLGEITNDHELLTLSEAAARLRLMPSTLRDWVLNRKIEYVKCGGRVRFRPSVIEDFIVANTVPAESSMKKAA